MADQLQQKIIELHGGSALLLAGPGCGKTHILAQRVFHANTALEVPFETMLCLTFTNRAAREMNGRIENFLGYKPPGLFIGNIHRFCLHFLFENELISQDTSVLDEEDLKDFLETNLGIRTASEIRHFLDIAAYVYQTENDHPAFLIRRPKMLPTQKDFERIELFEIFKRENRLIDFDRILLQTYTELLNPESRHYKMTGYRWIQVDEVQDMTPIQLSIVSLISNRVDCTSLFLGDEQQAIFRFIGAGGRALEGLKRSCEGRIYNLQRNYRSPRYLVELCNSIALTWLDINPDMLSHSVRDSSETDPLLTYTVSPSNLPSSAAAIARHWHNSYPEQTTTILVRTNFEGDKVAEKLTERGIEFFHVSRQDLFKQVPFKTVWAHLAILCNPHFDQEWARLLYQTKSVRTLGGARILATRLREAGISCSELLDWDSPGEVMRYHSAVGGRKTIVVFDTETTGLDCYHDDIIQISAVRMCGAEMIPGSEFEVFIESDKELPEILSGGHANPMVKVYAQADKRSPEDAFSMFLQYVGPEAYVAGHNLNFDLSILRWNLASRTSREVPDWIEDKSRQIDSLSLSRLLFPKLWNHSLDNLLKVLRLEGVNSHNAVDDVKATANLLSALATHVSARIVRQREIHANPAVGRTAKRFKTTYGKFFEESMKRMSNGGGTLSDEIQRANEFFMTTGMTAGIPKLNYLLELIERLVAESPDEGKNLQAQCHNHLRDLITYTEADLLANGIAKEKLTVMTVHKAKGLEMDNVIIYDAMRKSDTTEDYARWLYVACSRARRRLAVGLGGNADCVLAAILPRFKRLTETELNVLRMQ